MNPLSPPLTSSQKISLRRQSAFTLTELLVVVAIIGFLAALLVPSFKGVMSRAAETKCASNLRQLQAANISYANDHNGTYVALSSIDGATKWYSDVDFRTMLNQTTVSSVPGATTTFTPALMCPIAVRDNVKIGYGYNWTNVSTSSNSKKNNVPRSVQLLQIKTPSKTLAFIDGMDWQVDLADSGKYNGSTVGQGSDCAYRHLRGKAQFANVAFWDGHVEFLPRSAIDKQISPDAASALWTFF